MEFRMEIDCSIRVYYLGEMDFSKNVKNWLLRTFKQTSVTVAERTYYT